jgi:hypothetical protein
MIERTAAAYPEQAQDVSLLRSAAQAGDYFKRLAASRWRSWVELWLVYDPKHGNPQDLNGSNEAGSITVSYDGIDEQGHAHLSARSSIGGEQARRFGAELQSTNPGLAGSAVEVHTLIDVETDWPALRPWRVRTSESVEFSTAARNVVAESSEYRFDWGAAGPDAECTPLDADGGSRSKTDRAAGDAGRSPESRDLRRDR